VITIRESFRLLLVSRSLSVIIMWTLFYEPCLLSLSANASAVLFVPLSLVESNFLTEMIQLIVSSFSLSRMPFNRTLANLHCFVHSYHTNEYCRMKIMIDHAVLLWCAFALSSVLQLPTSSSPASSPAIVLQVYISVVDCSHHTNCICSHYCMKAPGKQLYITVSLSCSGFSIQNYRQNSYMLLLS